jgi:hypothetical protein
MAGIGSGLGGFCAIAQGSNTADEYSVIADYVAPTRAVPVKSAKGTYNPHKVQGGPYIRYQGGSGVIDLGSANVAVYQDAQVAMSGDFINTSMALMVAQVFGGLAIADPIALTALDSTTAYQLTDADATPAGLYVQDGTWVDMELGVPDTSGVVHYQDYINGKLTKAEWVFPRDNIVTFSYDWDYAYVVLTDVQASTFEEPSGFVPFTMPNSSSLFTVGADSIDGCRKITVTLTPKLATDRIYVGKQYKEEPITNGLIEITVALDMDYTPTAKSDIFDLFIQTTYPYFANLGDTVISAVGGEIGASSHNDTFTLKLPELNIQTGGEAPLEGLDIVKNTINLKATISAAGVSPSFNLITADTTY